jgi:hypothetical protein
VTRPLATDQIEAVTATVVRPFMAVEMDYPSGFVRLCSLPVSVVIDGDTYYGTGVMGEISPLEEGAENRSYGFTLTLCGIPGSWSEYLRGQDVQGRKVRVMMGFCDATHNVIGDPVIITVGRMDTQDVRAGKNTDVTVSCEDIRVDWERARVRLATDADHQAKHPGDTFFKYVAAMENIDLSWGRA